MHNSLLPIKICQEYYGTYRVIQEERSLFWEVISVIIWGGGFYMNVAYSGYRSRAD